jgi:hypothetical protein
METFAHKLCGVNLNHHRIILNEKNSFHVPTASAPNRLQDKLAARG